MDFEKAIREIQDTLVVMAGIESRMSRALADQAKWMEGHETRLQEHEIRLQEHEARMTALDVKLGEIADKLDGLINFVQRQQGFPEVQ